MRTVYEDQEHGNDEKYSKWRRYKLPELVNNTNCYCMDLDWVEWRKGKPRALIECRRALGSKTPEQAIQDFVKKNNGFQYEVLAHMSYALKIPGYIVSIKDNSPEANSYEKAEFLVEQVIPPNPWPVGRVDINLIKRTPIGKMDEASYANFINNL